MAERQIPATRIAAKLRRTEGAVRAEAARQRVLLAPTDKQPYGGMTARSAHNPRPDYRSSARSRPHPTSPADTAGSQDTLF
jgi:hypothetical protein